MAAKGFDYEKFARELAEQAQGLVPEDLSDDQRQYVVNTLGNFAMLSGKALAEDSNLTFDENQSAMITQIISEWTFHKSIDTIRSGIPQQYWDSVLQKVAYTIFEIAKQTFSQGVPYEKTLEIIELQVKKSYSAAIEELKNKGIIDEGLMKTAQNQSNMEKMAKEIQQGKVPVDSDGVPVVPSEAEEKPETKQVSAKTVQLPPQNPVEELKVSSKALKLATVAMLFNRMTRDKVQSILETFTPEDAQTVIKYMRIPRLEEHVGTQNTLRCLKEIKTNLPKSSDLSPNTVVIKIQKMLSKYSTQQIDTMLAPERKGVKRLVYNAIEGKYYDKIPPKVASVVATYLQNSV